MRFATIALLFGLTASSLAAPAMDLPIGMTRRHSSKNKGSGNAAAAVSSNSTAAASSSSSSSANSNAAAAGANVLTASTYADFQVSDGVAGNALAEVNAKFPVDTSNLAAVSDADAEIISNARETAENAEVGTGGFNDQIAAAGEDTAAGKALQVGKIKNKVLKLQLEVLDLQIKQAKGDDQADKIAAEQKKLDTNIATDKASAGQTSQSVANTFQDAATTD